MKQNSDLSAIRAQLRGVKGKSDSFVALCPAHDDTRQSLSVSLGRDGKVLFKCHAGCTFEAINAALDGAASRPRPTSKPTGPTTEVEVASYVYTDEDEVPLFRVLRFDVLDHERRRVGKTFKQQRHIGANEYEWGLGQTRRLLYRLPAIIEAVACGRTIFVVEGEKDADRLAGLGFDATTCAGGADAKWLDDYGLVLRGADVVILPDNDEPGKKHASKVTTGLHGIARSVRTIELPDLPPKGDVSDWLDAGHSPDELRRLIAEQLASDPSSKENEPRYRLYTVAELALIPEPEPLVTGVLSRATLAALVAKFASFKSFIALDLALHIALGLDWHGRAVAGGRVVYVYAEGVRGIRKRVEAWRRFNQLPDIGGIHFLPQSVLLNEPRDCRDLLDAIRQLPTPPIAVVIDTLARTFKGNESAAEDMNAYVAACDQIKAATEATVLLVHHTGWEGTRSRGATNLPGALDTELTLTRDGDRVTVKATKQKDGSEGEIVTLEAVPIGQSLAFRRVVPTSSKLTSNELRCLNEVPTEDGLSFTEWKGATCLPKTSFNTARKRLLDLGYVREVGRKWMATEAGRQARGTKVQTGTNEVPSTPVSGGTKHLSPLGGDVVPDLARASSTGRAA